MATVRSTQDMLTQAELSAFVREQRESRLLSVYVEARVTDPAMRHAWRPAMTAAVRAARATVTDPDELTAFDRAAAFLEHPQPALDGIFGAKGWVAFLAPDGPRYAANLPVRVPTLAVWQEGPFISPFLRALKQHRPVAVALVDSRSARLFRFVSGALTELPELALVTPDDMPPTSELRATSNPAPRGALGTERVQRRRRAHFQRLANSLTARLTELAGDEGWVLVGGTTEWARLAGDGLPSSLRARVLISDALDHDASHEVVARAAADAATTLRAREGRALLDRVLEHAGAQHRGVSGVPAMQRALRAQAVDLLLLSPEFLRAHVRDADDAVREALAHGADVEVLSGDAAERLDRAAGGIAGQLRFAIDTPLPTPSSVAV
jgi:hypothetical protein